MPDPLPERTNSGVETSGPLPETPDALRAEQMRTQEMLESFRQKARSQESLRQGTRLADRLAEASRRLEALTQQSQRRQIQLAEQAKAEFEARLKNPTWTDRLYENKEIIMAGAAVLALGALFFSKNGTKKWGISLAALALGGYLQHQTMEEEELIQSLSRRRTANTPNAPAQRPESGSDETSQPDILNAQENLARSKEEANRLYRVAIERAVVLRRDHQAPSREDRALFRQTIGALANAMSASGDEQEKQEYLRKMIQFEDLAADPNNAREVQEKLESFAQGFSLYLGASFSAVPINYFAKLFRERAVGNLLVEAARNGNLDVVNTIVRNHLKLNTTVAWKSQCEQLIDLRRLGKEATQEYRVLLEQLGHEGIDLQKARAIVREFSSNHWLVRFLFTESDTHRLGELYESTLSPALRSVMNTHSQAFEKIFAVFGEGGRGLTKFLQELNGLENAEEVLRRFAECPDDIARLIRLHGPSVVEALAKHASDGPRFAKLMEVLSKVNEPIDLSARSWRHMLGVFLKQLNKGSSAAEVGEKAAELLTRHGRFLTIAKTVGIGLEVIIAALYIYQADEIAILIRNIEAYASDDRLQILRERATNKMRFAGFNAAMGMISLFASGPLVPIAIAGSILSMGIESGMEASSEAQERRARSPQEWATERSRENLVVLWCTQRGLSDGDRLGIGAWSWLLDMPSQEGQILQTTGNKVTRKRLLQGIFLQEMGVSDGALGRRIVTESENLPESSELIDLSRELKFRMDFVVGAKADLDPQNPMEANRLLLQSKVYAQLQMEALRLRQMSAELQKLKAGIPSTLDSAFQTYLQERGLEGREKSSIVDRFAAEFYPVVTNEQMALYANVNPSLESLHQMMTRRSVDRQRFFLERASSDELDNYGGLSDLYPLQGALFDEHNPEHAESIRIRQSFEASLNGMYTLLSLSQQTRRPLAQHQEIEHCYNFCQRYYQSIYGAPYQPSVSTFELTEERIFNWIQTLRLDRRSGRAHDTTQSGIPLAVADEDMELSFNVSRQRETQALYGLATSLGYRGSMKKEFIQQFFSESKKNDIGFFFNGRQWEVVRRGMQFNLELSDWVREKLVQENLLVQTDNGGYVLRSGISRPASPERIENLLRSYEGSLRAWEDNPLVVDYLIDYCTRFKADMIRREDDRWFVRSENQSEEAKGQVGQSYADFLRAQQSSLVSLDTEGNREQFRTELNAFLQQTSDQYLALPPAMLRQGYLAGFDNLGMFAYKRVDGKILAWQLGPVANDQKPAFIDRVENNGAFRGLEFSMPLTRAIENLSAEQQDHEQVLINARSELMGYLQALEGMPQERKSVLMGAVASVSDDFIEMDKVVSDPSFEITIEHKRAFAKRMRGFILKLSQLVVSLRGARADSPVFGQILQLRNLSHQFKQLYLISFLHKSHVDEGFWSFLIRDTDVDRPDDYVRIEGDIVQHLNRFSLGELYANEEGIRRFNQKSEAELIVYLGAFPDSPEKNAYREYYLRETSQLIYLAHAYGFNDQGFLNDHPAHPSRLEGKGLEHLQRLINNRRQSFPNWLRNYRGSSRENVNQLATFDVRSHRRRIQEFLRESEQGINRTREYGVQATLQSRSLLSMCLAFRDLTGQLRGGNPSVPVGNFPELELVYRQLNSRDFLSGGLEGMGYTEAFTSNIYEMKRGRYEGNYAYAIDDFYKRYANMAEMGLVDLWSYLAIPKQSRDAAHRAMGDTEINSFTIKRAIKLCEVAQAKPFNVQTEKNDFELWYLNQGQILYRCNRYFIERDHGNGFFRAHDDDAQIFDTMLAEVNRIYGVRERFANELNLTPQMRSEFDRLHQEATAAIARTTARIRAFRGGFEDPNWVQWEEERAVLSRISQFTSHYNLLLTEMGVNQYWETERYLERTETVPR